MGEIKITQERFLGMKSKERQYHNALKREKKMAEMLLKYRGALTLPDYMMVLDHLKISLEEANQLTE